MHLKNYLVLCAFLFGVSGLCVAQAPRKADRIALENLLVGLCGAKTPAIMYSYLSKAWVESHASELGQGTPKPSCPNIYYYFTGGETFAKPYKNHIDQNIVRFTGDTMVVEISGLLNGPSTAYWEFAVRKESGRFVIEPAFIKIDGDIYIRMGRELSERPVNSQNQTKQSGTKSLARNSDGTYGGECLDGRSFTSRVAVVSGRTDWDTCGTNGCASKGTLNASVEEYCRR